MSKGKASKKVSKGQGQTAAKGKALREQQRPQLEFPDELPVSAMLAEIQTAIRENSVVIVAGATGSGKTTQIPKICLSLDRGLEGMIGLTQPRRLAAHSVARRLAEETSLTQGQGVGVQVRFDDQTAASTRVKVMTDGILLNELARDRQLRAYDTIIIDEAHERSLNIDFILACLKKILKKRPELRVIVTSATINTEAFSAYFDNAPVIEVSGRAYPVSVEYQELGDDQDLGKGVVDACFALRKQPLQGDTLVFLPGEREIRDVQRVLEKAIARNQGPGRAWEVIPVYGRLADKDQRAIFTPGKKPRVVLATNIAETSITVPRIASVIDSGIARLSRYSAHSRIQRLSTEPISQASAAQRSGRCGRLGPGICIRLFSENDFNQRPLFTDAEILRTNLASVVLTMQANRLGKIEEFEFIDHPEDKYVADAKRLLRELGALKVDETITALGRSMARLPLDPRLARVLLAAPKTRALAECLIVVAALSVADPRVRPLEQARQADSAHAKFADKRSDLAGFMSLWDAFGRIEKECSRRELQAWMAENFLAPRRMYDWRAVHRQLKGQLSSLELRDPATPAASHAAVARAFLTGFSGQLARLEPDQTYLSGQSSSMNLHPSSALNERPPPWILAVSLVRTRQLYARNCVQVDPAWVIKAVPYLLHYSYDQARWDASKELVFARETVSLGALVLRADREVPLAAHDPQQSRRLFILHALVRGENGQNYAFCINNLRQVELIAQAEGRERRSLSITERDYTALYEQVLPDLVIDAKSLDSWLKSVDESTRQQLSFSEQQLSTATAELVDPSESPTSISIAGVNAPLRYRFAPGEKGDGVTALLPQALREYLRPRDLDNAVPGLLRERIRLHLKALPKSYRQRLQPMNRTLGKLQQDLLDDDQDLDFRERLAASLASGFGIPPTACQWDALDEPAHLCVNVEFEQSAESKTAKNSPELKTAETTWVFGHIDPAIANQDPESGLARFAALSRSGDGVVLHSYARADRALREHASSVAWLAALGARQQLRMLRTDFKKLGKDLIGFYDLSWQECLSDDFIACVLDAAFPSSLAQKVSTAEELASFSSAGRSVLVESGQTLLSLLVTISKDYRQAVSSARGVADIWPAAAADIEAQIDRLIYPEFMQAAGLDCLAHFPRYLRAVAIRIERLPKSVQADAKATAIVQRFERRLTELPAMLHASQERERFRWLLEEFRVASFAQSLGTTEKVSEQRLEKRWQQLIGLAS